MRQCNSSTAWQICPAPARLRPPVCQPDAAALRGRQCYRRFVQMLWRKAERWQGQLPVATALWAVGQSDSDGSQSRGYRGPASDTDALQDGPLGSLLGSG